MYDIIPTIFRVNLLRWGFSNIKRDGICVAETQTGSAAVGGYRRWPRATLILETSAGTYCPYPALGVCARLALDALSRRVFKYNGLPVPRCGRLWGATSVGIRLLLLYKRRVSHPGNKINTNSGFITLQPSKTKSSSHLEALTQVNFMNQWCRFIIESLLLMILHSLYCEKCKLWG